MADEERKGSPFDLALAVWRRRRWLALTVFAVPLSAVLGVVSHLPNSFQSSSRIVVERQQVPEAFVRPTVTSELESRLRTITEDVLSRSRLQELIDRFGLYSELKGRVPAEDIIERVRRDIRPLKLEAAEGPPTSRGPIATIAFTITFQGQNPQTVAHVTNALASFYIEENLKVRERMATGTAQFLKVQLEEMKKRLDEQERRVSEFKRRNIGELPQQLGANLSLLERLTTQLSLNSASQIRAQERREMILKQLGEADSPSAASQPGLPGMPSAAPETPAMRLARLRQELMTLTTRFTDRHPEVIRVRTEIGNLKRHLQEATPDGDTQAAVSLPPSPQVLRLRQSLDEAESEVKVLKNEERQLRAAMETYQRRIENAPRREQEFEETSRDYETMKETYRSLLRRHEDAQLAESLEQSQKGEQFRILDPAIPSHEPAAPKRAKLILVGLVLCLGLGLGAVVLGEQLDTSFHAIEELKAFTAAPVIASIPRIVTPADAARGRFRGRVATAVAMASLVLIYAASSLVARGNEELVTLLSRGGS